MNVNYDQIKEIIEGTNMSHGDTKDNDACLEIACEKIKSANEYMTKEEAIIKLLIELPNSG